MKLRLVRERDGDMVLAPADADAEDKMSRFRPGVVYELTSQKDRSSKQTRLYWKCCDLLADNMDGLDKNGVALLTKIKCGLGTPVELVSTREVIIVPRSIALESMPQEDFQNYFTSAKRFWCETLIPGLGERSLMQEALNLLGEDYATQRRR